MSIFQQQVEKKNSNINLTQVILSSDQQKFVLVKKIKDNITDVISPFVRTNDIYSTKLQVSLNKLSKIQLFYDLLPGVASYNVSDNIVNFDCVKRLPDDMFGNIENGYIHYTTIVEKKKQSEMEIVVENKLTMRSTEIESQQIEYDQKVKFKTEFLKTFPSILNQGFILCTVDKQYCQIYFTLLDQNNRYIGSSTKFEIINIIQRILPLWSIFEIHISDANRIYIKSDFMKSLNIQNENNLPILMYAFYEIEKPNQITVTKLADYVNVDI